MIVHVGPAEGQVDLRNAGEFNRFAVQLVDPETAAAVLRTTQVGYLVDPANACINVEAVVRLAGATADSAWQASYALMVTYARNNDWLTPDDRYIRAHVDVSQPSSIETA